MKRFPMSIFSPLPAVNFDGCIAQNGFLVGTGSQYYEPYACEFKKTLFVEFSGNKITDFRGDAADITTAKNHYNFVAEKYGINPNYVHSWHAGMHPSCSFKFPASKSFATRIGSREEHAVGSTRNRFEIEPLLGWFDAMLVFRKFGRT